MNDSALTPWRLTGRGSVLPILLMNVSVGLRAKALFVPRIPEFWEKTGLIGLPLGNTPGHRLAGREDHTGGAIDDQ